VSQDKYFAPLGVLQEPNGSPEPAPDPRERREHRVKQLRLLWDNRRFLFRCVAWGLLFSALVALLIPSRYEATTKIMPPDNQSGTAAALLTAVAGRAGAGALGGFAGDLLGAKNSGALFVGILSSRTVQDRLIQQFDLQRLYRDSKIEDARIDLGKHTDISEERKSGILSVSVIDHDPKRAAAMSSAYVQELDRLVAQVSTSSARRERIFLEERLLAVKQDLDLAATKFSDFASKNTAIDIPAQGKAMVEAAARLQGELIVVESELRGLEAIYTDQNVRVRALRARVAELHSQWDKLGGDASLSTDPVSKDSNPMFPSIRKLPLLGVTYADLYRRTKIQETVFELLTQQYELAKVQEAKEIPSVKILDVAVVPTKKSFPPRGLITVFGAALFLLGACAWIFAKRSYAATDPQDPGKLLAEEVAVTVRTRVAIATARAVAMLKRLRGLDAPAAKATAPHGEDVGAANNSLNGVEPEDHLTQAAGTGSL
jgi:uncharacterized protein involved in exopolysaccharide biosynthesis